MKDLEDWAAVQKVYKQTKSKRATASILGISRNTVRKLLEMTEAPTYQRTEYHSKIDPFKEQIIAWRCEPYCFNGTRIFRELKSRGYTGSIGPVYRYLSDPDDVCDAVQNTFVAVLSSISRFEFNGLASLKSWLRRIAVNESLKIVSQHTRFEQLDDNPQAETLADEHHDNDIDNIENPTIHIIFSRRKRTRSRKKGEKAAMPTEVTKPIKVICSD